MKELTKTSTSAEIKQYFNAILKLSKASEEFPVNLDEVWPLVYERKDKAVEVLKKDFLQLPENEALHEKGERSDYDYTIVKERIQAGPGFSTKENYYLSVPCMEFFIARKVRDVFEVYRQVFHKTAKGNDRELISAPNFSNPAEAARAWADEYERRTQANLLLEEKSQQLDESKEWFSIKRWAKDNGLDWRSIKWRALKAISYEHGYIVKKIFDANYGEVNTYHIDVFGIYSKGISRKK